MIEISFDVFSHFRKLFEENPEEADRLKAELLEASIQNSLRGGLPATGK